jgi:predicted RNase H-like HicB family nuclease
MPHDPSVTRRKLRGLTAFEINLDFDRVTRQCYAEVPAIGVICFGSSESEALGGVQALALRILADRLEQGRLVPDSVKNLFWSDLRIEARRDKSGRWIAKIPSVSNAHCIGSSHREVIRNIKPLALRIMADLAEACDEVPWTVELLFPLSEEYWRDTQFVGAGPHNVVQFPAAGHRIPHARRACTGCHRFRRRKTAPVAATQPCLFD